MKHHVKKNNAYRMYREKKTVNDIAMWTGIKPQTIQIWVDSWIYEDYVAAKLKQSERPPVLNSLKTPYWESEEQIKFSLEPEYCFEELSESEMEIYNNLN